MNHRASNHTFPAHYDRHCSVDGKRMRCATASQAVKRIPGVGLRIKLDRSAGLHKVPSPGPNRPAPPFASRQTCRLVCATSGLYREPHMGMATLTRSQSQR